MFKPGLCVFMYVYAVCTYVYLCLYVGMYVCMYVGKVYVCLRAYAFS